MRTPLSSSHALSRKSCPTDDINRSASVLPFCLADIVELADDVRRKWIRPCPKLVELAIPLVVASSVRTAQGSKWSVLLLMQVEVRTPADHEIERCPHCGHVGEGAEPHVSIRAIILALTRFGVAPAEQVHALEKGWAEYRKRNGLDLYGRGVTSPPVQVSRCAHPQVR